MALTITDICLTTLINFGNINRNFAKKKPTGSIYLPVSQFHQEKISLELRLFLQDSVVNADPHIGKFINEHELYGQCPPRLV